MGKKINNYIEYQNRLKEFFSGIKEMPSSEEVQSFIDKYNLFIDWQIIILDVKKDISSLMLKNITGKSKSISSYKQYLVKLKESFGSLDEMPSRKQIEEFIEEYNRPYLVVTFLGILEMFKEKEVIIKQDKNFDKILVELR
mgnify:CR=1 FL=1